MSQTQRTDPAAVWTGFAEARPRSAELSERASGSLVAGVNHNIRATRPFPLYFDRADGARKWDVDGNEYVDYSMGSASLLLGHLPKLGADALSGLTGIPATSHENEVEWAELVKSMVPSAERVRFVSSGTEATLLALRIARAYTGRDKVMRFRAHYHGWHDYVMVGYRAPYDGITSSGVPADLAGSMVAATEQPFGQIEAALAQGDVAAVILEPSGASWGTAPLADGLLQFLRDVTREHGTVLIFDEMITGFRWAPGGVQEREGIVPDMTTLGKILTGGLPGGAVAGRHDIMEMLRPGRPPEEPYAFHFGTFNGHPITAALGLATLREVATGRPGAAAERHAADLRSALGELLEATGIRGFAYGESSTFHVNLVPAGAPEGEPDLEGLVSIPAEIIERLQVELRSRGVDLMSYNGGVASASHGPDELDRAVSAFEGAFTELRDSGLVATR
jgi:glutamate-1-semialdehyde 2,1-aminomutase